MTFLSLNVEKIKIPIQGKPKVTPEKIVYHNLNLTKKDAITATKDLIQWTHGNGLVLFTDGSFENNKGGRAASIRPKTQQTVLYCVNKDILHSNHKCEILGVIAAVELIQRTNQEQHGNYYALTDNKGVLLRMKNTWASKSGQYVYNELMKAWICLKTDGTLHLVWCLGNSGIKGNEAADFWENKAALKGKAPGFKLYGSYTKACGQSTASHMKPKSHYDGKKPSVEIRTSSILSQLASGYCSLNKYLHQIRKIPEPICIRCGYHKDTVTHFFHFCPAYTSQQRTLNKNLCWEKSPHNPSNLSLALLFVKNWTILEHFVWESGHFTYPSNADPGIPPKQPRDPPPRTQPAIAPNQPPQ